MSQTISGWGHYPVIDAEVQTLHSASDKSAVRLNLGRGIARGLGRSYGDSSLASRVVDTLPMNRMLSFDSSTGELCCEAGVTLADILHTFLNRGWFLPVTPGTKYVTVGGAIASDVHGKNHHRAGCFSDHLTSLKLMDADGDIYRCSREEHPELFRATCGGMGLTGIILEATFNLIQLESSLFDVVIHKAKDLEQILGLFETYDEWPYSVAWLDCLASGKYLGRSLLMAGRNSRSGGFDYSVSRKWAVPYRFPAGLVNKHTVSLFNALYFHRFRGESTKRVMDLDAYFYPLDGIRNWNRMYGSNGFLQYQFVLPKRNGYEGLKEILQRISASGKGSFLSVLKLMGEENDNYLSFPMKGYTLSLDFRVEPDIFGMLDELDRIVLRYGGRLYLTKDARMRPEIFRQTYPGLGRFRQVRRRYNLQGKFESEQSKRLEI